MMECMTVAPEIVGRQGQYANDASDPVIHPTSAEECSVAAIVLDHEEAYEETGSRHGEQQVDPVAGAETGPHENPEAHKRHGRDGKFDRTGGAVRLPGAGEDRCPRPRIACGM